MDEEKLARLGETLEPGDRDPAPGGLRTVQQFLNTRIHEFPLEHDRLATPSEATEWLASHGLLEPGRAATEPERAELVGFREALRAAVAGRLESTALEVLERVAGVCVHVSFSPEGVPGVTVTEGGFEGVMGRILAASIEAAGRGEWDRLKTCGRCDWAFYDRSRNRSGQWCSMSICGNRLKNRAYRRRQRRPFESG